MADLTFGQSATPVNIVDELGNVVTTSAVSSAQAIDSNVVQNVTPLDKTGSGNITALNGTVSLSTNGTGSAVFQVTGTFVATLVAEGSVDNTNWTNLTIFPSSGAGTDVGITTTGSYRIPSNGAYAQIRIRASAFTSGTATVRMNLSAVTSVPQLFSPTAVNAKIDALSSKEAQSAVGNTFGIVATAFNITPANSDVVAVFLKNPNASGKTLVLHQIEITNAATSGGTSSSIVKWKLFANPTSSANGTAQTINSTSIGSGFSSVITAFTGPTISANGTLLYSSTTGSGSPTLQKDMTIFRLAANNNLLITCNSGVNNTTVDITVLWSSEG